MRYRGMHAVSASPAFSLKCYLNQYPVFMLMFFFLLPGVLIFGAVMRIFERPLKDESLDFDNVQNAW